MAGGAPAALSCNVPKAKVYGVEIDAQIRPANWLTLGGAYKYTYSRFGADIVFSNGLPQIFDQVPVGVLRESDSSWYMREEAGGLLLGPYEVGAPACDVDEPSAFGEVGVKRIYNGAIASFGRKSHFRMAACQKHRAAASGQMRAMT